MASLLDTDVLLQRVKALPDNRVVGWLSRIAQEETFLSVITLQEVREGIERMPEGRKRSRLQSWLEEEVLASYADRILAIDAKVADVCGQILGSREVKAFHHEVGDAYIAATALVHGLKVATLNRKHFERLGVELVEF